jgi:hypothetical protein
MTGNDGGGAMRWNLLAIVILLLLIVIASEGRADYPEPLLLREVQLRGKDSPLDFESEHRPQLLRQYHLISSILAQDLKAFVLDPTGNVSEARLASESNGVTVSFKTPFGDGPMHGVHNLYVLDQQVIGNRLVIRTAKWHTIQHNCGWGHAYKHDSERIRAKTLDSIPLEISCGELWDGNFHAQVRSGDLLHFCVRLYGVPLAGARIRLTSGKGWTKQSTTEADGTTSFQLIRDYYPMRWNEFNSRNRERFTVVAEYEVPQTGVFSEKEYDRILYISSIPWIYSPSRDDYTSYLYGLFIGFFVLVAGIGGVYVHRERRRKPYREIAFSEKD